MVRRSLSISPLRHDPRPSIAAWHPTLKFKFKGKGFFACACVGCLTLAGWVGICWRGDLCGPLPSFKNLIKGRGPRREPGSMSPPAPTTPPPTNKKRPLGPNPPFDIFPGNNRIHALRVDSPSLSTPTPSPSKLTFATNTSCANTRTLFPFSTSVIKRPGQYSRTFSAPCTNVI